MARESFCYLTTETSASINRRMGQNFKKEGLAITPEQYNILKKLWQEEGKTQIELANHCNKDRASITRIADRLEKQNLVVRIPDASDKRLNRIYLTKSGKDLKERAVQVAIKTMEEAMINIDQDKLEQARAVLLSIMDNLSDCKN